MNCETCSRKKTQEINDPFSMDSAMAHMAKIIRLLIICMVICVFLLAASNAAWLYAWNQYDYESSQSEEIIVDGKDGAANYIGGDNSGRLIIYGIDSSTENIDETTD